MEDPPSFLVMNEDGSRKIAYRRLHRHSSIPATHPGIIFIHGYLSNMATKKALALEEMSRKLGISFVRFDLEGAGHSTGDKGTVKFDYWLDDCLAVLNDLTVGPQLIIGSSIGGWLALLIARLRPKLIHSLVLVSPALNYLKRSYETYFKEVPLEGKKQLESGYAYTFDSIFGEVVLSKGLYESSLKFNIDINSQLNISCPVRIIHGCADALVSYKQSMQIVTIMESKDVDLYLRKGGSHSMSSPDDIELLLTTTQMLLAKE